MSRFCNYFVQLLKKKKAFCYVKKTPKVQDNVYMVCRNFRTMTFTQ